MMTEEDFEDHLSDDELQEARQWVEDIHTRSDGAHIESSLVAHLVTEVDRLRNRVAQLEAILTEQRRIMGERQLSLFPPDAPDTDQ